MRPFNDWFKTVSVARVCAINEQTGLMHAHPATMNGWSVSFTILCGFACRPKNGGIARIDSIDKESFMTISHSISHAISAALLVVGTLTGAAHGSSISGEADYTSFKVAGRRLRHLSDGHQFLDDHRRLLPHHEQRGARVYTRRRTERSIHSALREPFGPNRRASIRPAILPGSTNRRQRHRAIKRRVFSGMLTAALSPSIHLLKLGTFRQGFP